MGEEYFQRMTRQTPTRFWINNPTFEEVDLAIASGAISCTTNPAFCARMLNAKSESAYTLTIIDKVVQQTSEDKKAAEFVMQHLVKRIAEKFLPLYIRLPGLEGFVSIQGNPNDDEDPSVIVEEALRFRKVEKNIIAKIPMTQAGMRAIEILIPESKLPSLETTECV
jgi:transaldolase